MKRRDFSIIIPAYNAEPFIRDTIESVLRQSEDAEIIVVDDGSTDRTAELARDCGSGVMLLQQRNAGESAARNAGYAASHGERIAFLDADDLMKNGALAAVAEVFARERGVDLVYGRLMFFGDTTRMFGGKLGHGGRIVNDIIRGWTLQPGQFYMRRALVERVGLHRTDLRFGEDWDFVLRASRMATCRFISCCVLRKRVHRKMQSLQKERPDIVEQRMRILEGVFGDRFDVEVRPLLTRRVIADWLRTFAFSYADSGNARQARQYVLRSLRKWPFQPALYLWLAVETVREAGRLRSNE